MWELGMMHLEVHYLVASENKNNRLFKNISIRIKYYNTDCMAFTCVLDVSIVGIGIGFVAARPSCSKKAIYFLKKQYCLNSYHVDLTAVFSFSEMV